jgi:hypothetical protein
MAIRGIANREKRKEEKEKSQAPSPESLNSESRTRSTGRLEPQDDKTHQKSKDITTVPEVFDSSKYDSMTEMKESAYMKEGGHLKEVLSSVEKEEPIKPTVMDTKLSSMDTNSHSAAMTIAADASPPSLEEKAAALRGSKEEQIVDRNLEKKRVSQEG